MCNISTYVFITARVDGCTGKLTIKYRKKCNNNIETKVFDYDARNYSDEEIDNIVDRTLNLSNDDYNITLIIRD